MLVHRLIVGAALGGLATVCALVLILNPEGSERLIVASALQIVIMAAVMHKIMHPGERQPLTWPKAMLGAVLVSGFSLLALGQVPHEWITLAGSELGWGRRDLILIDLPILPFDISRMAVRDIIAAGLYTNTFAGMVAMWLMWQRRFEMAEERAKEAEAGEPVPAGTSAYGRPVMKQT